MAPRYIPSYLKHSPTPQVRHFALLTSLEAVVRATLITAMPLAVYDALGSAGGVSLAYLFAGTISMVWGLMVPWGTRHIPRRYMYSLGCGLYLLGAGLGTIGALWAMPLALMCLTMATATTFVCINAYILDYVARENLGRTQSLQMFFAAGPWAICPLFGVWLRGIWAPLPFIAAGGFALILLIAFWILRLGDGKQISKAKGPATNPLGFIGRFLHQPRLIVGWLFAVVRSSGWWAYLVYLPIYCVQTGLGDEVAGMSQSLSNALLFTSPLMLKWARSFSLRQSLRLAYGFGSFFFALAALSAGMPILLVIFCFIASISLVLLDVIGGLPFMMAVRPAERTEMSAVYSSFRDVSGVVTPGIASLVFLVAPLPMIFAVSATAMAGCFYAAGKLHPRLGLPRRKGRP